MFLGWTETLGILAASAGLFVWARAVGGRAPDPARPRLLNHTWIMFAAALVALMMIAHIITLATGRGLTHL